MRFLIGLVLTGLFVGPLHAEVFDPVAAQQLVTAGADNGINYFSSFGCSSSTGINTIRKLNILPLGTHPGFYWKDSLFVNAHNWSGGYPVIWFTNSDYSGMAPSVFTMGHAAFDGTRWNMALDLANPANGGGVSSFDGTDTDYVFNEYLLDGWGPMANKPGSSSLIPGVAETRDAASVHAAVPLVGYPLVGSGPYGLSTIRSVIQNLYPDVNTRTCLHMNPTMFNYDSEGRPTMMAVDLWTYDLIAPNHRGACVLPDGSRLPSPGYYLYSYNPSSGWQLATFQLFTADGGGNTLNRLSAGGTTFAMLRAGTSTNGSELAVIKDYTGAQTPVLSCTASGLMAEAAGISPSQLFFLGDAEGCEAASGLAPKVCPHDIYYAFHDTSLDAPAGWYNVGGAAIQTDGHGHHCYVQNQAQGNQCFGRNGDISGFPGTSLVGSQSTGLCACAYQKPGWYNVSLNGNSTAAYANGQNHHCYVSSQAQGAACFGLNGNVGALPPAVLDGSISDGICACGR